MIETDADFVEALLDTELPASLGVASDYFTGPLRLGECVVNAVEDGVAPPRRLGPGDVVFFPAGAAVRWTVETPVRKLAFFRRQMPTPLGLVTRAGRAAKDRIRARRARASAPRPVTSR